MKRKHKITIIMNEGLALHDLIMILLFSSFKVSYFFELIRLENKLICIGAKCKEIKFRLYHIKYITSENTFQIMLHNSGGHFGLIL